MALCSWAPDRRATRAHIRAAIAHAQWEKTEIATKPDSWYARASDISRRWRDDARRLSLKTLARNHLEYWRMRAFLGVDTGNGQPWDRPMHRQWQEREAV